VFRGEGDIRVEEVPDPTLEAPTDAIVRIVRSSVCGSDLWSYRGISPGTDGSRTGHELTGIVEEVGEGVTDVAVGDLVVAPFAFGDGTCEFCRAGLWTSCPQGGFFGGDINGGHAERARIPWADANLWVAPAGTPEDRWDALHLLTDVLLTGWHAGVMAGVGQPGIDGEPVTTAVVIGDGAVGLSGVLSARQQGAERVIAVGHHDDRLEVARGLGATEVVNLRGKELRTRLRELTDGGAASVLECVGVDASLRDAIGAARPGGHIGMVGVPAGVSDVPMGLLFRHNITLTAGVAPTNAYIGHVGPLVASGAIDPSPIASDVFPLEELPAAFAAMDERRTVKAILHPFG
jgi:threonine dehydrogenase-like Zn-dependent dehydrogenase